MTDTTLTRIARAMQAAFREKCAIASLSDDVALAMARAAVTDLREIMVLRDANSAACRLDEILSEAKP